jgi:glucan phosphoethanolaminetransferase (alkaline phosphatase superfamily)
MLLGLVFLAQIFQVKYSKAIKIVLGVLLVIWQGYTLSNYLTISAGGHYAYAAAKTVPHFSDLFKHLSYMAGWKTEIMLADFAKFFLFALMASTVLYIIYTRRDRLSFPLMVYFQYSTAFLLVFCVLNLMNSKNNGMKFVRANELEELVTITDHEAVYSFVYITDAFRSQHYNCKDPELRKIITEKHAAYLDIVKPLVKKASPELQRALDEKDLNYSFYSN